LSIYSLYDDQDAVDIFSPLYLSQKKQVPPKDKKNRIIVLSGPTAIGKSDLSIKMAKLIKGEIVSADSMQVYKGMDIGTAKVRSEQQEQIPHHLIDIFDIDQECNVVNFYHLAHKTCREIIDRGNVPIVVGGSGYYIHVFLHGPPQGPSADPQVRVKLEEQMNRLGSGVMYERLQMLDPMYAETISENDRHKIVRALEIIFITKRPVSALPKPVEIDHDKFDYRCWFIYMPKQLLYEKVQQRCEVMIEQGFIEEVERLKKQGLEKNFSAANAIGYRQCLEYLNSPRTAEDLKQFIEEFKKATRHYVKRQFTWFRKEPFFRWLDINKTSESRALEYILQDFEQGW